MAVEPTKAMQVELAGDLAEQFAISGTDLSSLDILDVLACAGHALVPDFGGVTSPAYQDLLKTTSAAAKLRIAP